MRNRVLPPLRDVTRRPELGNSLRNKLCRLMTSPVNQIDVLVAEFLFVLCKENGKFCSDVAPQFLIITCSLN